MKHLSPQLENLTNTKSLESHSQWQPPYSSLLSKLPTVTETLTSPAWVRPHAGLATVGQGNLSTHRSGQVVSPRPQPLKTPHAQIQHRPRAPPPRGICLRQRGEGSRGSFVSCRSTEEPVKKRMRLGAFIFILGLYLLSAVVVLPSAHEE